MCWPTRGARGHVSAVAVTLRVQMNSTSTGGVVTILVLTQSVDGDMTVLRFRSKLSKSYCPKYLAMKTLNIIYIKTEISSRVC